MAHVSDIKLIRTDTTLDLSQKAEKGMNWKVISCSIYTLTFFLSNVSLTDVGRLKLRKFIILKFAVGPKLRVHGEDQFIIQIRYPEKVHVSWNQ